MPTEAASGVVDARPLAQPVSATGTLPGIVSGIQIGACDVIVIATKLAL